MSNMPVFDFMCIFSVSVCSVNACVFVDIRNNTYITFEKCFGDSRVRCYAFYAYVHVHNKRIE